ncbi:MAG TPA: high-potential iron-sulfur protein [Alphaproteobacteria bacterium]|nr:high-potential iron-sulfur protein [Alphaproteobacteria bacterium]
MDRPKTLPRRQALAWLAAVPVGAAAASLTPADAEAKAPKKAVNYQYEPKDGKRCEVCQNWQPPDACKLIRGEISPDGWCQLWSAAA